MSLLRKWVNRKAKIELNIFYVYAFIHVSLFPQIIIDVLKKKNRSKVNFWKLYLRISRLELLNKGEPTEQRNYSNSFFWSF